MRSTPIVGRLIGTGDDESGHDVVVLSEELWKSRFGGNPAVVGTTMTIDGKAHEIVGVLPSKLAYPAGSAAVAAAPPHGGGARHSRHPRLRASSRA